MSVDGSEICPDKLQRAEHHAEVSGEPFADIPPASYECNGDCPIGPQTRIRKVFGFTLPGLFSVDSCGKLVQPDVLPAHIDPLQTS